MKQNPLNNDDEFAFTIRNPNPRASHLKSGMKYTVEIELAQGEWQDFADAYTTGMVIECVGHVTHRNLPGEGEGDGAKGGMRSKHAAMLCNNPDFFEWITTLTYFDVDFDQPMDEQCRAYLLSECGIESRRYLDHDTAAAKTYDRIVGMVNSWEQGEQQAAQ